MSWAQITRGFLWAISAFSWSYQSWKIFGTLRSQQRVPGSFSILVPFLRPDLGLQLSICWYELNAKHDVFTRSLGSTWGVPNPFYNLIDVWSKTMEYQEDSTSLHGLKIVTHIFLSTWLRKNMSYTSLRLGTHAMPRWHRSKCHRAFGPNHQPWKLGPSRSSQ